jgi:hypothetical protein
VVTGDFNIDPPFISAVPPYAVPGVEFDEIPGTASICLNADLLSLGSLAAGTLMIMNAHLLLATSAQATFQYGKPRLMFPSRTNRTQTANIPGAEVMMEVQA